MCIGLGHEWFLANNISTEKRPARWCLAGHNKDLTYIRRIKPRKKH